VAFALLARSLGGEPSCLTDEHHVEALVDAVAGLGRTSISGHVDRFAAMTLPATATLRGRWVRWFDLGRVPPYEGSNVVVSAGGVTPRLADIAGYYRAFGMQVVHDRPDHIVAELEFLAFALLVEDDAFHRGDAEHVEVVGDAIRTFIRDHVGTWIDAWTARVHEIPDLDPWAPLAAAAADLVRLEASLRNVIPARSHAVLVADTGVADDAEALLECE
jgi:nitrate reductase assembly molybdenum cofactor insertion protein NarJ